MNKKEILKKIKILMENHESFLENKNERIRIFLESHSTDYFVLYVDMENEIKKFVESNLKIFDELKN